jgi:hypothetical protein
MATATTTGTRTVRLVEGESRALVIRQESARGVQVDAYFVSDLPGGGYRLSKHDGTAYEIRLDGTADTCTCPGHVYRGRRGTVCKHVGAVRVLRERGKL